MINQKSTVEQEESTNKNAVRLRAFRAAAWPLVSLLALSCSKEPIPPVCIDGECTAFIAPVKQTGDYYFDINEDDFKVQYFTVEVYTSKIDPYWFYNDIGRVTAEWSGNLQYLVYHNGGYDVIDSADRETYGQSNEDTTVITQLIGVKPEHSGKTLDLTIEILWDAGGNSIIKTFSQKITLK